MNLDMIALQPFTYPYGREALRAGQRFTAQSERDFNALKITGRAKEDTGESDKGAIVPPELRPKRKYQRRDMQAE